MANDDYHKDRIANRRLHPETLMMGYGYAPGLSEGSLKPPIFLTSTFVFENAQQGKDFFDLTSGRRQLRPGEKAGLVYSRFNNPNLEILEDRLAIWDQAEQSAVFASGMAAISTTLFAFLRPGDAVLHSRPLYGGTETLLTKQMGSFHVTAFGFTDGTDVAGMRITAEAARAKGRVGLIFVETPANPTNGLVDLEACAAIAGQLEKRQGFRPPVVADNTMLGPVFQVPLKHGADLSLCSLTKYVGGHSDLVGGSISGATGWDMPSSATGRWTELIIACDACTGASTRTTSDRTEFRPAVRSGCGSERMIASCSRSRLAKNTSMMFLWSGRSGYLLGSTNWSGAEGCDDEHLAVTRDAGA